MKTKNVIQVNQKVVCYLCEEIVSKIETKEVKGENLCINCFRNYQEELN